MGARLAGCVALVFLLALEIARSEEVVAPGSGQVASCPTVLPVEEGERSIVVPTIAPKYAAPHVASQPLPTEHEAARSLLVAKLAERDRLEREIAALRETTRTPEQISVKVKVLEIYVTKLRQSGLDPSLFTSSNADQATLETLDTLVQQKLGRVLAEPSVVTTSGQKASINVGGEFPIPPLPGDSGGVKIQKYGTQLDVSAVSLGNNKVRLSVQPRISEIDTSRSIVVDGKQIPALTVRECKFSRELEFGKSAVLPGMLQERKVPAAGWSLRQSDAVEQIALVVVVTPEIVK
jgi:Flp pilus assembly secretin CpaC